MKARTSTPRGPVARSSVVGAAVVKVTATKAGVLLGTPFRNETDQAAAIDQGDREMAATLFRACCTLRGTALKLAQVFATENELLPVAYREQFAQASHAAVPINRALVRRVLKTELGDLREHFSTFCDTPFAAASLGQVHAATSHQGEPLAVKIQYPGIDESVSSDLLLLRALLKPTRWSRVFESCFEELRERLAEELDYEREAEHTAWFGERHRLCDIVIPRVYTSCSRRRVLVTHRLEGHHLNEWLKTNPSIESRQHYAQLLVDWFHHCIFDLNCIHADPNFGNFIFRRDGQLGVIDFGCVRTLDGPAVASIRAAFEMDGCDPELVERIHSDLGVRYRSDVSPERLREFLRDWAHWLSEPYRAQSFNFGDQGYFEHGDRLAPEARHLLDRYEGAFLYFARAQQGLFRMLQALNVPVRMRLR